ncbi:MAG TPA: LysE family translocator [Mycobacteriales bacterium]|nr:LysE family translocator [Mycobacteriales bacterium]
MVSTDRLVAFALTSFVLIVIPGPGVLFVVGRALAHGRRTALLTVAGHVVGNYVVAVAVAFGLGSLLERSDAIFLAIKFFGAAYLVVLGLKALLHRRELVAVLGADEGPGSAGRAARQGFVVGLTNPKALILFGAVLPQFVNRSGTDVPVQMLLLALLPIGIGLVSDSMWGLAASAVRSWFGRSRRRLEIVGGTGGLAMIGVGVTVAVTGRQA